LYNYRLRLAKLNEEMKASEGGFGNPGMFNLLFFYGFDDTL